MKKLIALVLAAAFTFSLVACSKPAESKSDLTPVTIGASPAPHAEILEACKAAMAEKGYDLQITEFTDYVMPNTAVESGDLMANYFAHQPYQTNFNEENGTHIVTVCAVHFEPLGLYPGKTATIAELADGAQIAIPNDATNGARALLLLEQEGIITLKEGIGLKATVLDITENPNNVKIIEVEAAQAPNVLADVDFAVINGNYAVDADLLDTVLASEDAQGEAATLYANILCVKEGSENDPGILALAEVLQSEEIREFINKEYKGVFVPVF